MADVVVEAKGITRRYGAGEGVRAALDDVSFQIEQGEFTCVLGHSGSGKSTLLGIMGCLDQSFEGTMKLFGKDVKAMREPSGEKRG